MKHIADALRVIADHADVLRVIADQLEGAQPPAQPADVRVHPGTNIPYVTGNFSVDYVSAMIGMQHRRPTPERDGAINRYMDTLGDAYHGGVIDVARLSQADKAYLARMQPEYFSKTGKDIMRDGIIAGGHNALNAAMRDGDAWRNNFSDDQADPALRQMVQAKLQ